MGLLLWSTGEWPGFFDAKELFAVEDICQKQMMIKAWVAGCFLLMAWCVEAQEAVTRAWHFANSPVEVFLGSSKPKEIAALPLSGVFANKGDRLIDLSESECFRAGREQKGWLVWNETQQRLIAHDNPLVLAYLERSEIFQRETKQQVTFSWYRNVPLGAPVPDQSSPEHQMEISTHSGKKGEITWKSSKAENLRRIELTHEFSASGEPEALLFFGRYQLQWEEQAKGDQLNWTLNAAHYGRDDEVKPIIQVTSPSGETWTVTCRVNGVLEDGTLVKNSRWIESDGKAVLIAHGRQTRTQMPREIKMSEHLYMLGDYLVPRDAISMIREKSDDPFHFDAQTEPAEISLIDFQAAVIPIELKPWVPFPMMDLRKWLRAKGVPIGDKDFAGYDPMRNRMLVAAGNQVVLDLTEQLFEPMCVLPRRSIEMDFRIMHEQDGKQLAASGCKLGCLSGQKALIQCADQKGLPKIKGEFDPTLAADDQSVDVDMVMEWQTTSPDISIKLKKMAKVLNGIESTMQSNRSGGVTSKATIKAKVME